MQNGHPHLMAMVRGAEGEGKAIVWLKMHGFDYLAYVALGADNDDAAIEKLIKLNQREWAGIALKIRSVKNKIEEKNNDMHRISPR